MLDKEWTYNGESAEVVYKRVGFGLKPIPPEYQVVAFRPALGEDDIYWSDFGKVMKGGHKNHGIPRLIIALRPKLPASAVETKDYWMFDGQEASNIYGVKTLTPPEGYRIVAFRFPKKGEIALRADNGAVIVVPRDWENARFILEPFIALSARHCEVSVAQIYGEEPKIPAGYEYLDFDMPRAGKDQWLSLKGSVASLIDNAPAGPRIILKVLPKPTHRYIVEFPDYPTTKFGVSETDGEITLRTRVLEVLPE